MKNATAVRTAFDALLKSIKVTNGYQLDLPDDRIYPYYNQGVVDSQLEGSYTRVSFWLSDGSLNPLPQHGASLEFYIGFVLQLIANPAIVGEDVSVQSRLEKHLADLYRMIGNNNTLQGTVTVAHLSEFHLDGGVKYPEGVLVGMVSCRQVVSFDD